MTSEPQTPRDDAPDPFPATRTPAGEGVVGEVLAIDVGNPGSPLKRRGRVASVLLRVAGHDDEWYTVARPLTKRVHELARIPEQVVGHRFMMALDRKGFIVAMTRR